MHETPTHVATLSMDAFSDGQMASKLWLSQQMSLAWGSRCWPRLVVFGSWYGLLPFVLKMNSAADFTKLVLCDIDQESLNVSRRILNHWECRGLQIETLCVDCNEFPQDLHPDDLVINTSCEHMDSLQWWHRLPSDIHFIVQSTNMKHPTHIRAVPSMEDWKRQLGPIQKIQFEGSLFFSYPDKEFHRWMIIGQK